MRSVERFFALGLIVPSSLSAGQFAATVLEWSEALDPALHGILLQRILMVEHLWMFDKGCGVRVQESVSYQLGFGQCSKQPRISEDAADLAMRDVKR